MSKARVSRSAALGAVAGLLASVVVAVSPAGAAPAATLALSKGAFVSGTNTPLTTPVTPGGGFDYQLPAACSGLTEGCTGATTTDVLPPGVDFVGFDPSPLYTVNFSAATRTVTVTYTSVLPSPPNPAGSVGIPAGSTRTTVMHVELDPATTAPDGSTITNVATATASDADPSSDSTDITVSIPTSVTPVASKSMNPDSLVAKSEAGTTAVLGVSNASAGAANVTSLTVADTTASTWDTFDLDSVGPVESYPQGADEVSVGYCTSPAPCTPADFTDGPFQTGSSISLPVGVDPTTVTGIRFTFDNSAGAPLPTSSDGGSVDIGLTIRNTDRSTGSPIDPTGNLTQSNCATPSAVDDTAGLVTGADVCTSYTVLPGIVGVAVSKQVFADADGSFTNNGFPVSGQTPPSGVSAVTTAKNTSAFAVTNMTITDPSTTAPSDWTEVNPLSVEVVFPSGATAATGQLTCSDGSTPDGHRHRPAHDSGISADLPGGRNGDVWNGHLHGQHPDRGYRAAGCPRCASGDSARRSTGDGLLRQQHQWWLQRGSIGDGVRGVIYSGSCRRRGREQELIEPSQRRRAGPGPDHELHPASHQSGQSARVELRDRRPQQPTAGH